MMDIKLVRDLMENEVRCINKADRGLCDRACEKCPLVKSTQELLTAYGIVIDMLEERAGIGAYGKVSKRGR